MMSLDVAMGVEPAWVRKSGSGAAQQLFPEDDLVMPNLVHFNEIRGVTPFIEKKIISFEVVDGGMICSSGGCLKQWGIKTTTATLSMLQFMLATSITSLEELYTLLEENSKLDKAISKCCGCIFSDSAYVPANIIFDSLVPLFTVQGTLFDALGWLHPPTCRTTGSTNREQPLSPTRACVGTA
jgi:hypothetical protein